MWVVTVSARGLACERQGVTVRAPCEVIVLLGVTSAANAGKIDRVGDDGAMSPVTVHAGGSAGIRGVLQGLTVDAFRILKRFRGPPARRGAVTLQAELGDFISRKR
jgi:hypothetical protein